MGSGRNSDWGRRGDLRPGAGCPVPGCRQTWCDVCRSPTGRQWANPRQALCLGTQEEMQTVANGLLASGIGELR